MIYGGYFFSDFELLIIDFVFLLYKEDGDKEGRVREDRICFRVRILIL